MLLKRWSSRFSFVLTTSAFAIGLGNVWRFPYIVAEYGGGAFLLVYLLLVLLIGIPLLTMEITLGRLSRSTPLVGFGKLSGQPIWNGLGWLVVVTNMIIMSYYVMILAWVLIYFWESLSGSLSIVSDGDFPDHFKGISSDLRIVLSVIIIIMLSVGLIINQGLKKGLERYTKVMMIGLIVMMVGLTIWAATLDGAISGYLWYLEPDFAKINMEVITAALGQVFFSIGVGMAIAFTFGSYTVDNENLIQSTCWIVLLDTFFAILAGLMIFPILFSFDLSPDSGPNLIFVTLASAFAQLDYSILGAAFFLLLFFGGFTSLVASVQGLKDSFEEKYSISEFQSLCLVLVIISVGSVPVVYSFDDQPWIIAGMTLFGLLDYVTNSFLLPLGGLLIALFAAYVVGFDVLKDNLLSGMKTRKISDGWKIVVSLIIPLVLLYILLGGFVN